jgi:hypothetical protein
MSLIKLRKVKKSDIAFFSKWWRDEELINLTSGDLIDDLKLLSIELSKKYDGNIQIQLDVNKTNRIAKIRVTENIS